MFKKYFKILLLCTVLVILAPASALASDIKVYLNGSELGVTVPPVIENGRTMVPMRTIFEELGYQIVWDGDKKVITARNDQNIILMQIQNKSAYIDGAETILDAPPMISNGYTLVPLRFVAEASGASVEWLENSQSVIIKTRDFTEPIEQTPSPAPPDTTLYGNTNSGENQQSSIIYTSDLARSVVMIVSDNLQGSGFIIGEGLIATNYHVIDGAENVEIVFSDFSKYTGEVLVAGYDYDMDIAILKIDKAGMIPVKLGDSSTIANGDPAVIIASPLGVMNSVSSGFISGFNSSVIYTTADIEHGSSGGALFNHKGEVIGIPFSFDTSGKNYALPINMLKNIALDKYYSLSQMSGVSHPVAPPRYVDIFNDGEGLCVTWESIYNADGYYLFFSDSPDGYYTATDSPVNYGKVWSWGYPYTMKLTTGYHIKKYLKIATVRDGIISDLSEPYEITVNN